MSLTDSVADFLKSMESYPGNPLDLELSIGPLLERVRSQQASPADSQESTPSWKPDKPSTTPSCVSDVDEEDDEFMDPLPESKDENAASKNKDVSTETVVVAQIVPQVTHVEPKMANGYTHQTVPNSKGSNAVNEALQKAIESLRRDLTLANEKVKALEERQNKVVKKPHFLFGSQLTPGTQAFIILWPIFVHFFLLWLRRRKH